MTDKRRLKVINFIMTDSSKMWTEKEIIEGVDFSPFAVREEIQGLVELAMLVRTDEGYLVGAQLHQVENQLMAGEPFGISLESIPITLGVYEVFGEDGWLREGYEDYPELKPVVTVESLNHEFPWGSESKIYGFQVVAGSTDNLTSCMMLMKKTSLVGVIHSPDCNVTQSLTQNIRENLRQNKVDAYDVMISMGCSRWEDERWMVAWV